MSGIGWPLALELLALGATTGFLAGLLGVGGGMTMVPFMTWILSSRGVEPGLAVKMAIGTSMATIVFTSMSSVRAHHQRGCVRWDLLRTLAPGLVFGGLFSGAGLFAVLRGKALALVFAVFIAFAAVQMLLDRKPAASRQMPGFAGQTAVGTAIGLISGLVGAGGAFLSVPFMIWCNVPLRQAVGTAAALGFPIALANTTGYVVAGWDLPAALPGAFGYLYLPALGILALASTSMAPLGARVAHGTDVKRLERIFAVLLLGLGGWMAKQAFGG